LINWINQIGEKNWTKCAELMKKRTAKEIKERFFRVFSLKTAYNKPIRFVWAPKEELLLLLLIKNYLKIKKPDLIFSKKKSIILYYLISKTLI